MSADHGEVLCPRCGEYMRRWHDCEYGSSDNGGRFNPRTSSAGSMYEANTN